jgi:hypothetical protein
LDWLAPQEAYGGILVTSGLEQDSACALYWIDAKFFNRDGEIVQQERICSDGKITRG